MNMKVVFGSASLTFAALFAYLAATSKFSSPIGELRPTDTFSGYVWKSDHANQIAVEDLVEQLEAEFDDLKNSSTLQDQPSSAGGDGDGDEEGVDANAEAALETIIMGSTPADEKSHRGRREPENQNQNHPPENQKSHRRRRRTTEAPTSPPPKVEHHQARRRSRRRSRRRAEEHGSPTNTFVSLEERLKKHPDRGEVRFVSSRHSSDSGHRPVPAPSRVHSAGKSPSGKPDGYKLTFADIKAAAASVNTILSAPAPAKVRLAPQSSEKCRTDDPRTRVLVMLGCSGSTFVQAKARELARLHGYCVAGDFEPFDNDKKKYEKQADEEHKTFDDVLYEDITKHRQKGTAFAMKATQGRILSSNGGLFRRLQADGMVMVHVYRSNSVDLLSCMINDCFGESDKLGYAVYPDGKRSKLCFQRRFTKDLTTQLYISTDHLHFTLNHLSLKHVRDHAWLKSHAYEFDSIPVEELMAYETSWKPEDMDQSLKAWKKVMKSWGITPDTKLIADDLKNEQGSRLPEPHWKKIYNYGAVSDALQGSPLAKMLEH